MCLHNIYHSAPMFRPFCYEKYAEIPVAKDLELG